jgi:hypothetical protein
MFAGVVELVDTRDLKSLGRLGRAGSSPASGTNIVSYKGDPRKLRPPFLFVIFILLKKLNSLQQATL